jgi:SH3-like domain-containing protein
MARYFRAKTFALQPCLAASFLALTFQATTLPAGAADGTAAGTATGLPVPRYVSLKSDRVNLREGPSKDHRTRWVYQRAGLPVEVTAEFEIWRRVRDSEGAEGWVLHSLLSGRRTAIVSPWVKSGTLPLYEKPSDGSSVIAQLQPKVVARIKTCDGAWCRIFGEDYEGWMTQDKLWGAYPGETVE